MYNYEETKTKLMDLQLENPNPLPIHYINGFKNWMQNSHNLYLDDKEVQEIHDFMESAKEVHIGSSERGSPNLKFKLRNGKVETFNKSGSDFIRAMRDFTAEVKVKITGLTEAEMEQEILSRRIDLSIEFSKLFKDKNLTYRDTGEPIDWNTDLENGYDFYELPPKTTTKQVVSHIKSGKMSLFVGNKLLEMMQEQISNFVRE